MNVASETNEALKNDTEISRIKSYCKSIEPCVRQQLKIFQSSCAFTQNFLQSLISQVQGRVMCYLK